MLPRPMRTPEGMVLPFPWVRLWPPNLPGRAFVSGHGPLLPDGSLPEELTGKVGTEVSETERSCPACGANSVTWTGSRDG